MGKNNGFGQAEILSDSELDRIFKNLNSRDHKLFFIIARFTGERLGAIARLKVSDVYANGEPLGEITFPANIRKAAPDGSRSTRQVYIVPRLHDGLLAYKPKDDRLWLFPSDRRDDMPITWSAADKWLRAAVLRTGLENRGISGHSLRRSFITKLYESGMDIHCIQEVTGHKSLAVLQRYIGKNPARVKGGLFAAFA
jgi:integrase/recombinase XerD